MKPKDTKSSNSSLLAHPIRIIRFGACEIDVASREVLFCRKVSPIGPRAFDVLLYLIEHRDRVVSKNELLDAIWRTTYVSESVVARMVMKIRRVIGDTGSQPRLVRTVHRIGYRFIGTIETVAEQVPAPYLRASTTGERPERVALLPFRNATAIPELGWLELGMTTLVSNALTGDPGIAVLPLRDVMLADAAAPASSSPEHAAAVLRATGADFVISARVSGTMARLLLEWSLLGRGRSLSLTHAGIHLPQLAQEMSVAVRSAITQATSGTDRT